VPSLWQLPLQHSGPLVHGSPTPLQHVPRQLGESKQQSESVRQLAPAGAQQMFGVCVLATLPTPQMVPVQQSPGALHEAPVWPQHVPSAPQLYPVQQS
jgi:hypothetical protein